MTGTGPSVWLVVFACGLLGQAVKFLLYSLAHRRPALTALVQGNGLPSLPAVILSCLVVAVSLRTGWGSSEAGFALVFAVIVVHDTLKMGWLADRQREALVQLLDHLDDRGDALRRAGAYLDPRAHNPVHVAVGLMLGGLFGLAFGMDPR